MGGSGKASLGRLSWKMFLEARQPLAHARLSRLFWAHQLFRM